MLQLPLNERWRLVQQILASIQYETVSPESSSPEGSEFQHIYYRLGSSGKASPTIKGTRIRVQTIAISAQHWNWQPEQIAEEYGLSEDQVVEALKFYELHKADIDSDITSEAVFAATYV